MSTLKPVDVTDLWRLLDLITPMALRVAATLRVADHIAAGNGSIEDTANRAQAHLMHSVDCSTT